MINYSSFVLVSVPTRFFCLVAWWLQVFAFQERAVGEGTVSHGGAGRGTCQAWSLKAVCVPVGTCMGTSLCTWPLAAYF